MNDKTLANVRFIEVNHLPEFGDQITSNLFVDNVIRISVDGSTLLRLDPDGKLNLDEQDSILAKSFLTSPKTII